MSSDLIWLYFVISTDIIHSSSTEEYSSPTGRLLYPIPIPSASSQPSNIFSGGPVHNVSFSVNLISPGTNPGVISVTNTSDSVSITFPLPPGTLSPVPKGPIYGFPPYALAPNYSRPQAIINTTSSKPSYFAVVPLKYPSASIYTSSPEAVDSPFRYFIYGPFINAETGLYGDAQNTQPLYKAPYDSLFPGSSTSYMPEFSLPLHLPPLSVTNKSVMVENLAGKQPGYHSGANYSSAAPYIKPNGSRVNLTAAAPSKPMSKDLNLTVVSVSKLRFYPTFADCGVFSESCGADLLQVRFSLQDRAVKKILKSGALRNPTTSEASNAPPCLCSSAKELYFEGPLICDMTPTVTTLASAFLKFVALVSF